MSSFIQQFSTIFGVHLRDSPTRLGALMVSLAGAAGTTFILVSVLSIANGVNAVAESAGSRAVALITAREATLESVSSLPQTDVDAIRDLMNDGSIHGAAVSPELVSTVDTLSRGGEAGAQVVARALTAEGVRMREHFRIVAGRGFNPGRFEVIVGRRLARDFAGFRVAVALAIILGIGAIVATVNTMYSAMASRQRSLATMRAVGFGAVSVAAAVFAECLTLGLVGALIGGGAAWVLADGWGLSLLNTSTKTPLAFDAAVTLKSFLEGVAVGAVIGALSAVLPSYSAARMSILDGLRAP